MVVPNVGVIHPPAVWSDLSPLMLNSSIENERLLCIFGLEAMWVREEESTEVIKKGLETV